MNFKFPLGTVIGIILFQLVSLAAFAQPFISENKRWNVDEQLNPWIWENSLYIIQGDTLIGGLSYSKILKTEDSLTSVYTETDWFIRETPDKKVYWLRSGYELLLYDFGMQVGDTMHSGYCEMVLLSIDSVQLSNAEFRQRYNLHLDNSFVEKEYVWIEGIGNMNNPLIPSPCMGGAPWFELLCFEEDGIPRYPEWIEKPCNEVTTNIDSVSQQTNIEVFPNPTTGRIYIETTLFPQSHFTVTVFNSIGQLITSFDIDSFPANRYFFDINNAANGIYFLVIDDGISQVIKPIVVKRF